VQAPSVTVPLAPCRGLPREGYLPGDTGVLGDATVLLWYTRNGINGR